MPKGNVKTTRIELIRTRARIRVANKGLNLLKTKRSSLVLAFFDLARQIRLMRGNMRNTVIRATESSKLAELQAGRIVLERIAAEQSHISAGVEAKNVMGVRIPSVGVERTAVLSEAYELISVPTAIEDAKRSYLTLFNMLIEVAEKENSLRRLLYEIEKLNRRANAIENLKLHVETIPTGLSGSVTKELKKLESQEAENARRRKALGDELSAISKEYYPIVSAVREQLDIEVEKQEITTRLGMGRSAIAVDGWVPSTKVEVLRAGLRKVTDNSFVIDKVKTDMLPPTKLDNPVTARLFEFFIRFYSLPRSDEFDPTVIFALVFPIFFGFMIGDVGYGAVMLAGSIWLIHRLAHPPAKSRLPKALTNFVHMIISDNGLNVIARSIIPGAIIAIVLGVLFNEYFGFQLPYPTPFDVEVHLSTLLVISGWIGVFMVSFGFVLGFLNKFFNGETKHAAAKLGWLASAWGIVIIGLAVLHKQPLGIGNPFAILSYALLVGGVGTVLYGEGFQSLMELPSLISHILSYTRLVGILLASVILAQVIDFVFVRGWYHSIWLGLLGTLILVVGQLFNIVIALFEPGIQGARLIYVEFFSKFFSGNGNAFRPFASKRRRTLSTFEVGVKKE